MIAFPHIDPVIIQIGPLALRWYGLMYILGFTASYLLVLHQIKKSSVPVDRAAIDDLFFYLIVGLIIGARLGYVLFYNFQSYFENPGDIFKVWQGGMSFHGGLIGTIIAGALVIKVKKLNFFSTADLIIPTCPIGIGFGRIGNFINGELYGKTTTVPWAMVFPQGGDLPRHPSQLYEMFVEGFLLFAILWVYKKYKKHDGNVFALFLVFYGMGRIFCELFREPDVQLGYFFGLVSMGQILSFFMIAAGLGLFLYLRQTPSIANR